MVLPTNYRLYCIIQQHVYVRADASICLCAVRAPSSVATVGVCAEGRPVDTALSPTRRRRHSPGGRAQGSATGSVPALQPGESTPLSHPPHGRDSSCVKVRASDEMFFPTCLALVGHLRLSVGAEEGQDGVAVAASTKGVSYSHADFQHRRVTYCLWTEDNPKSPFSFSSLLEEAVTSVSVSGEGEGEGGDGVAAVAVREKCFFLRKVVLNAESSSSRASGQASPGEDEVVPVSWRSRVRLLREWEQLLGEGGGGEEVTQWACAILEGHRKEREDSRTSRREDGGGAGRRSGGRDYDSRRRERSWDNGGHHDSRHNNRSGSGGRSEYYGQRDRRSRDRRDGWRYDGQSSRRRDRSRSRDRGGYR